MGIDVDGAALQCTHIGAGSVGRSQVDCGGWVTGGGGGESVRVQMSSI